MKNAITYFVVFMVLTLGIVVVCLEVTQICNEIIADDAKAASFDITLPEHRVHVRYINGRAVFQGGYGVPILIDQELAVTE